MTQLRNTVLLKKLAFLASISLSLFSLPMFSLAATMEDEVAYMLDYIGDSSCTFVRNEITYSSREFQQHLRSKVSENDDLLSSAEDFIEKIGTRSATSGSAYIAVCDGELKITKFWFTELLESYRSRN